VLGALSALAVPAGVAATEFTSRVELLGALEASVPVALVLALASIVVRRRARRDIRRSINPDERPLRLGKWLGWIGLYLGLMGALSLGFYALLRHFE
jgi:hypothetical protein